MERKTTSNTTWRANVPINRSSNFLSLFSSAADEGWVVIVELAGWVVEEDETKAHMGPGLEGWN